MEVFCLADIICEHRPQTPTAFGTSPKFDVGICYSHLDSGVEFGGGWEGVETFGTFSLIPIKSIP